MSQPLGKPRRILIRSPNWLGDVVMSTAAVEKLKRRFPDAEIIVLAQSKLSELWVSHPLVGQVLQLGGDSPLAAGKKIRALSCDLAVLLPNSLRSALEVFLGRVPARVGYGGGLRNVFLTMVVPRRKEYTPIRKRSVTEVRERLKSATGRTRYPTSAHHVLEYLHLVEALGANTEPMRPKLEVTEAEVEEVSRTLLSGLLAKNGQGMIFGLNPGAEYGPAKRWPAENFAAVAREVSRLHGEVRWVVLGGKADAELCREVAERVGTQAVSLAGRTTLRQLMAVLKKCRVLITNDTGPMHVAAALGTPVVGLFGSTSPELTGPGLPSASEHELLSGDVACAPCFLRQCPIDLRCLKGISVQAVVAAVEHFNKR